MRHSRIPARTISSIIFLVTSTAVVGADPVRVQLDPSKVVNRIDEKVYGHFLEHIFHSVNGGLWGEMIWNRSFEENNAGRWRLANGEVLQESMATNQRLTFGDPEWRDYELTLEAKKTGGQEGFLILFRVKNDNQFYWANLGGWGNRRHQLERGLRGGQRWGPVGPAVDGGIEAGRWYRIKVRCEGRRFQVWLGERLLIDFTDDQRAHLNGKVGIGTWSTKAAFRNVKVTTLAGDVLHAGLPEVLVGASVARHWKPYGSGKTFIARERPLNSGYSQRIVSAGGETGLEQTPISIRKGEAYQGSLWARGSAAGGLVVRLVDGEKKLAEAPLPAPGDDWREYPFRFAPTAGAEHATVQVGLRGKGEVWIDQVSMLPDAWRQTGGFRPDLLQAVADLKPPVIRWPGGCFASAYRWKDGVGPQHRRGIYPLHIWDDQDVNSFGTDEFIAMCRKVAAEPLIVVNIGTPNWNGPDRQAEFLREVCDWIEYSNGPATSEWGKVRAANGHPEPYNVKYWEIDNETWHMGAEEYARWVRRFAAAMKKVDPSIKLGACGSGGFNQGWNRTVIERSADVIDYLSIHHYESPNRFQEGPRAYERFFRETAEIIAASRNPGLKLYVSEWNAQSTDWRTGLYAGGLLNGFERCGDVLEIGGPALFLRHVSATAWDNAFINFDHRRWFPAPNYVVMKLWREHYAPHRIESSDPGPLNAVATKSARGRTLYYKAVNPTDKSVLVRLEVAERFEVGTASLQLVAPGALSARNTLDNPAAVRPEPAEVTVDGGTVGFTLPAYSAGAVTITRR